MNAELVTALESAVKMLGAWQDRTASPTVQYEIYTAKVHAQRAIDWEKARPEIDGVKP